MSETLFSAWLQFLGALLAALVGVALWYFERRRQRKDVKARFRNDKIEYRRIIFFALSDLAKQINYIEQSFHIFCNDYNKISTLHQSDQKYSKTSFSDLVSYKTGEMTLHIPNVLQLSLAHARFLSDVESAKIADILADARSVNVRLADLKPPIDGVPDLGEALHVVANSANLLYSDVDSLRAAMESGRGGIV